MKKDLRYKAVKVMAQDGLMKVFSEVLKYLPKTLLAKDLGFSHHKMNGHLKDPTKFMLKDLNKLATLFELPVTKIVELINEQESRRIKRQLAYKARKNKNPTD